MDLKNKKCLPCEGNVPPLKEHEIRMYKKLIEADWQLVSNTKIVREFKFVNFSQTMDFVNSVADLAEAEGHHPNFYMGYGFCTIEIWTHAIDGLSENDFILAAKIDEL